MFIRVHGKTDTALVNMDKVVSVVEPIGEFEEDGEGAGCVLVLENVGEPLFVKETVDEVEQLMEYAYRRCCTPITRNVVNEKGEVVRVDNIPGAESEEESGDGTG